MKLVNTKLKKSLLVFFSSIILLFVVVIIFISPIAKYLVEKYDEQYTGRQIKIGWAYVNPFTGYVYLGNVKIYEAASDSIFLTANSISANFSMLKMFRSVYEITELTLNKPKGFIIMDKEVLNFDDVINRFSKKQKPDTTPSKSHFNLLGIKINDGEFHYLEKATAVNYFIKNVNIESSGLKWNTDTIAAKFSFASGMGKGTAAGDFTINYNNLNYRLSTIIHQFDLEIIAQYLKDLINYGNFSANFDADINATGNFKEAEDLHAKGLLAINDLHLGKKPGDDIFSFDKFILDINELSPKDLKYIFDSVSLHQPFIKYELYDSLDNIQRMFGKKGENLAVNSQKGRFNLILEIAKYAVILAKNFLQSDYKINRIAIYKGEFLFNDYSLSEKFSIAANPFYIIADSVNKHRKRVEALLKTSLKPYGEVAINLSINPNDTGDFDIHYALQKLPAAMFNPYTITYTSYPLDRGTIELNGTWNVRKGMIQSVNHLLMIDPRLAKKIKNKDLNTVPLPLIMAFVRERGNVIDYEVPITGNLKSPKFHFRDVILHLLQNILIKPPTIPYSVKVKQVEADIEKTLSLQWDMRQVTLRNSQEKFIEKMTDFLEENKEASLAVYPLNYTEKEKEHILFFEAKKKYFLLLKGKNGNAFDDDDSEYVNKMSVKDPSFVRYLNRVLKDSMLFTIQDKCMEYIGAAFIENRFSLLKKERADLFISYFKERNVGNRVKIYEGESTIPYNGFSAYKILYKGELPEYLINAYKKMNELNDEPPRKKLRREREKNKNLSSN
jgi:hypothetical protein